MRLRSKSFRLLSISATVGLVAVMAAATLASASGSFQEKDPITTEQPEVSPNRNDFHAEIARSLPGGYGGIFVDPDDETVINILLTDPTQEAAARDIADLLASEDRTITRVNVIEAKYDFDQLYGWYQLFKPHIGQLDGFVFGGVDYQQNQVKIAVSSEEARKSAEAIADQVGIPRDAITFPLREPAQFTTHTLQSDFTKPLGGIHVQISSWDAPKALPWRTDSSPPS